MDTASKTIDAICEISGISKVEVKIDSHLYNDLDLDSLDMSQVVIALEKQYKIGISDEEMSSFRLVRDIVDSVNAQLEKDNA